jgi:hypothetical protein
LWPVLGHGTWEQCPPIAAAIAFKLSCGAADAKAESSPVIDTASAGAAAKSSASNKAAMANTLRIEPRDKVLGKSLNQKLS